MRYRELGRTGLEVSEIGFGAEWMEKKSAAEVRAVVERCEEAGINILDCWMAGPEVRSNLGAALAGTRDRWIIQGHIGSTWQDGQYVRTRDMNLVRPAFEDLLARLGTDHVELGMIHYVDDINEYEGIMAGEFIEYVRALKAADVIGHIGLSTHAPEVAKRAALSSEIEAVMFSVNPAFDLLVYCFRHFSRSGRALYLPFQIWDKGRVEGGGRRTTSWDLALDDRIAPPTRSVTWIRQDGRSGLDI